MRTCRESSPDFVKEPCGDRQIGLSRHERPNAASHTISDFLPLSPDELETSPDNSGDRDGSERKRI